MANKFTINNIKLIGVWYYKNPINVDCTICRCNINSNSLYNQDKGIDSNINIGLCGHAFHTECIEPWIRINKYCPICASKWVTQIILSK